MTGSGKMRSDWNAALLTDALAPLYASLLATAAGQMGACGQYWALWPAPQLPMPWVLLARQLYREVRSHLLPAAPSSFAITFAGCMTCA